MPLPHPRRNSPSVKGQPSNPPGPCLPSSQPVSGCSFVDRVRVALGGRIDPGRPVSAPRGVPREWLDPVVDVVRDDRRSAASGGT